ncbi:MAG: exosortase [Phycisphaerales bacterium]|nr:exosortase [Phycisphaerales bacterium]
MTATTRAKKAAAIAPTNPVGQPWPLLAALGAAIAALIWAYWPVIWPMYRDWQNDPNYSVGQLVPLAALYLVWERRASLARAPIAPHWAGLLVIGLGQLIRLFGLLFLYESVERYSIVVTLAGVVLLIGGKSIANHLKWTLVFLLLMVPLPGKVHNRISGPLQTAATTSAVVLIELTGVAVAREGNIMTLNGTIELGVAEACSGLRMLTAFLVVAYVFAVIIRGPAWQRVMIALSGIPIAIACNVLRLYVTAMLCLFTSSETARVFFHDYAGVTMMPIAIALLVGELALLRALFPDTPRTPGAKRSDNHQTSVTV